METHKLLTQFFSKSKENAVKSVIEGSTVAKNAREEIENKTGKKIVSSSNNKNMPQLSNKFNLK